MNILLTNDDGISSNGIKALEFTLKKKFHTFLIAPLKEKSATSQALSIHDKLRVEKINYDHYIVDGFPVDCVNIGLHGKIFPSVDIVISGINRGVNMGHDVHYSGTVGAARHAAIHGKLAFAVSSGCFTQGYDYVKEAEFIYRLLEKKLDCFKTGIVYNINFPEKFEEDLNQIAFTKLGIRTYEDTYEVTQLYENISEFFLGGSLLGHISTKGSDFEAFYSGKVSITPISIHTTQESELLEIQERWKL